MDKKIEGIDFCKVKSVTMSRDMGTVTSLMAILKIHGELPRDEKGVATITIRQLIGMFASGINPVLAEYVCAFGAHGLTVLERYVLNNTDSEEARAETEREVHEKYSKFKAQL